MHTRTVFLGQGMTLAILSAERSVFFAASSDQLNAQTFYVIVTPLIILMGLLSRKSKHDNEG